MRGVDHEELSTDEGKKHFKGKDSTYGICQGSGNWNAQEIE